MGIKSIDYDYSKLLEEGEDLNLSFCSETYGNADGLCLYYNGSTLTKGPIILPSGELREKGIIMHDRNMILNLDSNGSNNILSLTAFNPRTGYTCPINKVYHSRISSEIISKAIYFDGKVYLLNNNSTALTSEILLLDLSDLSMTSIGMLPYIHPQSKYLFFTENYIYARCLRDDESAYDFCVFDYSFNKLATLTAETMGDHKAITIYKGFVVVSYDDYNEGHGIDGFKCYEYNGTSFIYKSQLEVPVDTAFECFMTTKYSLLCGYINMVSVDVNSAGTLLLLDSKSCSLNLYATSFIPLRNNDGYTFVNDDDYDIRDGVLVAEDGSITVSSINIL